MAAKRPFSLATRLTFFISLATIIAFFAFTWIMIHSVKAHFEERDVHDLRQLSTTLETVLNHADYPQARRLEIVRNIIAGLRQRLYLSGRRPGQYSVSVARRAGSQPYAEYAGAGDAAARRECDFMD
ncbi:hypothetical protein AE02_02631 [Klebsiella variicola]|nr:hypothetical protein AE02_02631 [Klebsiella variicola]